MGRKFLNKIKKIYPGMYVDIENEIIGGNLKEEKLTLDYVYTRGSKIKVQEK